MATNGKKTVKKPSAAAIAASRKRKAAAAKKAASKPKNTTYGNRKKPTNKTKVSTRLKSGKNPSTKKGTGGSAARYSSSRY